MATALIDTFVVRLFLVPALMFCAVDWNWWPGRLPRAELDYLGARLQSDKLLGVVGPFSPAASEAESYVSVN